MRKLPKEGKGAVLFYFILAELILPGKSKTIGNFVKCCICPNLDWTNKLSYILSHLKIVKYNN